MTMSCHSKKLFIIYKTTYFPTKKIYIGQHKVKNERTLDPWYVGSGSEIEDLQNKDKRKLGGYWRKLYKREVLAKIKTNDIRVVNNIEVFYILKFDSTNPAIGYNIIDRATIFDVERMDERVKKKISNSLKGKMSGENHPMYGKHHSVGSRKLISKSMKGENNPFYGHQHTEETKRKMSEAKIGTHVSKHVKDAVSRTHKGKIVSNEIKNKISLTTTGRKSITNGIKNSWLLVGQKLPDGWRYGRLPYKVKRKKRKDRINHNTTTGKMCITNGVENLYILKTDDIPQGYYKGLTRGLKK